MRERFVAQNIEIKTISRFFVVFIIIIVVVLVALVVAKLLQKLNNNQFAEWIYQTDYKQNTDTHTHTHSIDSCTPTLLSNLLRQSVSFFSFSLKFLKRNLLAILNTK